MEEEEKNFGVEMVLLIGAGVVAVVVAVVVVVVVIALSYNASLEY